MISPEQITKQAPELEAHSRTGLRALGSNSRYVQVGDTRNLLWSADLDKAYCKTEPDSHRWDYLVLVKTQTPKKQKALAYVEVHPANSGRHIHDMRKKADWLRAWVQRQNMARKPSRLFWIATGPIKLNKNTKEARLLSKIPCLDHPLRRTPNLDTISYSQRCFT